MAPKKGSKRAPKKATERLCPYGHVHNEGQNGAYIVPSLLDPPVYLCSKPCYDRWCAEHPLPASINERRVPADEIVRTLPPQLPL